MQIPLKPPKMDAGMSYQWGVGSPEGVLRLIHGPRVWCWAVVEGRLVVEVVGSQVLPGPQLVLQECSPPLCSRAHLVFCLAM